MSAPRAAGAYVVAAVAMEALAVVPLLVLSGDVRLALLAGAFGALPVVAWLAWSAAQRASGRRIGMAVARGIEAVVADVATPPPGAGADPTWRRH